MKKISITILALILLIITAIGGLFFYYSGKEYVFRFSESQIQEKLNTKLPLTKTYLLIFQLTLDNPRVNLTNNSKRVGAGLDVILNIKIGNETKPLGGAIDISGGVTYLPDQGKFFLTDPIVERVAIQGIPEKYSGKVNLILTKALAEYYADHPIYSLRATDIKQAAAKLLLKNVVVEDHELVVTLGI